MTSTELNLDDSARRALGQVYALLLRLAHEAAEGDTLDGDPGSAASTSDEHRCTSHCTMGTGAQQEGAHNG